MEFYAYALTGGLLVLFLGFLAFKVKEAKDKKTALRKYEAQIKDSNPKRHLP